LPRMEVELSSVAPSAFPEETRDVARYYLSWQTKRPSAPGLVELELPDDEAAWREAAMVAYDLWNHPADRRDWGHLTIHVSDGEHQHLVSLSLDTLANTEVRLVCVPAS